ncbi:MAG TPA: Fic family protein [Bryobacteraceae bacterium]|jgi:cell filamentation protein
MTEDSVCDRYVDPTTGVLKNRLGITDRAKLEEAEAALVAIRSFELGQKPLKGNFDLAHLQAIHRHLFHDVYEWAGELRTVDISKGSNRFAHHNYIQTAAESLFEELAAERHLTGINDLQAFSVRGAHYLGELNAIHPFRDGNGRTQREFISHLAHKNGYYIAWENVKREDMLEGFITSFNRELSKLTALLRENIFPLDRG